MLLTSPIVRSTSACFGWPSLSSRRCCVGARPGLTISRRFSNRTVMPDTSDLFRGLEPLLLAACDHQRLVDILDDVGRMLDADRQPDGFRQDAGHALLFGGHLAVSGRGRMARQRFRVAD